MRWLNWKYQVENYYVEVDLFEEGGVVYEDEGQQQGLEGVIE